MKKIIPILLLLSARLYSTNESSVNNNGSFTENKGQIIDVLGQPRPDIFFVAEQPGMKIYFRKTGISYVLIKNKNENNTDHSANGQQENLLGHRIDMDFVNSNNHLQIISQREVTGGNNYYYDHCPQGIKDVKSFEKIIYKNVFPKIDLVFYTSQNKGLKYDVVVNPGGNPSDIAFKYTGQDNLEIENGDLKIKNSLEDVTESMPKVYQNINGKIIDVKAHYKLNSSTINFELSNFDHNSPLIIDPWCTYFGGSLAEQGKDIKADNNGNIIFVGTSGSTNFPTSIGAHQTNLIGMVDAFIAKFNSSGQRIWVTYYGGSSFDEFNSVDVDAQNNVFACGATMSGNLALSAPSHQPIKKRLNDIIIAKFTPSGFLDWSTFYGGDSTDIGCGISIDKNNDVVIVARTSSTSITLPVSPGAIQSNRNARYVTTLVAKFSNIGSFIWSTYFGGAIEDDVTGVDTDNNNDIIFVGLTRSKDYPTLAAGGGTIFQSAKPGVVELSSFVTKVSGVNGVPIWSTYCGGSYEDTFGITVAADAVNDVYVAGTTYGPGTFPVTAGCFQPLHGGGLAESYLAKFNANGSLLWATYIGGSGKDESFGLVIDNNNDIYVSGDTYSNDFPTTTCAYATGPAPCFSRFGCECGYIFKFDPYGNRLCSGYIPWAGSHSEEFSIAEYKGSVYILCSSTNYSLVPTTPGAFQPTYNGWDIVLNKLCGFTCGLNNRSSDFFASKTDLCIGETTNFTSIYTSCDTSQTSWLWNFQGAVIPTSTQKRPSGISYSSPGSYNVTLIVTTPCDTDTVIKAGYINIHQSPLASSHATGSAGSTGNICNGQTATLTANASGGLPAYTYNWSLGNTGATVTVAPSTSSVYQLTVTDSRGCSTVTQTSVTVFSLPAVSLLVTKITEACDSICIDHLNTSPSSVTVNWTSDNGISNTGNVSYRCYYQSGIYSLSLTVTDNNGCTGSLIHFDTVLIHPRPIANFMVNPTTTTIANPIVNFTNQSASYNTWIWNFGDGVTDNLQLNPSHSYDNVGFYCILLTVANEVGCEDTSEKCIDVEPEFVFYIPNTFTPNGDGTNDSFLPKGIDINGDAQMLIFDRWGNLIYKTSDLIQGWDGRANGGKNAAQQDVYVWKIKCSDITGNSHHYTGHVTLLR